MEAFIILVANGDFTEVREHDRAPTEGACMSRARFNGERPLLLAPDETAYIFFIGPRGHARPIRVGFAPSPTAGGFPRWGNGTWPGRTITVG